MTRVRLRVPRPRPRTWLALIGAVALLVGGYMWLRESSLAQVRQVDITGLAAKQGSEIRSALRSAALDMTTLHVRLDALRSAVSPFPIVKDIKVRSEWPHRLTIRVIEYRPVAVVDVGGRRTPVSADGTLLRGEVAGADLPAVPLPITPGGARVSDVRGLAAIAIVGSVPDALRPLIATIESDSGAMRVKLTNGPDLIFGNAARARAKWAASTRVLADPSARGATYIDVRVPERAVAGPFPTDSSSVSSDGSSDPAGITPDGAPPPTAGP